MSYCRFQNTLGDLQDCGAALADGEADDLGEEEERAMIRLISLCREIAEDYGEIEDEA